MNYSTELNNALAEASTKEQWLSILQTAMGTNHKLVGRESSVAKVSISYSGLPVVNEYNVVIDLPYSAMNMSSGTTNLVWRLESTDGSVWAEFPYRFKMTNTPDPDKGLTFIRSIKIPAPSNLPEDESSLDWSGLPSSFSITVGNSVNLSSYVSYSGSGSLTYSSIGTSLSGTGISLNSSTGILSVDSEATTGTVTGVQIRVTDGTLSDDSNSFSVVKESESEVLTLNFPSSFNLTRTNTNGSGNQIVIDFEDFVSYSGSNPLVYTWVGGRPSNYLSLNSSTVNDGYPGRLFIAANSPPLSFPSLTMQVTDGVHTQTATFTLTVSVPGYSVLRIQELSSNQVASKNGEINLRFHTLYDDVGTLVYSSIGSSLPSGATLNSGTGILSLSNVAVGTYTGLQFRVTDGVYVEDSPTISLQVVDEDLIYPSDLDWLGAFRFPSGMSDIEYPEGGIGVDPNGNSGNGSLFVPGHNHRNKWGEISIPTPVASTNKNSLNRATELQAVVDAFEGTIDDISPPSHRLGGSLAWGSEVVLAAYQYYGTSQTKTHWIRPRNLSTTGSLVGPVEASGSGNGNWSPTVPSAEYPHRSFAGYMATIPSAHQTSFGGPAVSGQAGLTNEVAEANGPHVCVFDPDDIGVTNPLPFYCVVGYPDQNSLCERLGLASDTTRSVSWNQTYGVKGMAIPSSKDAFLVFGVGGSGEYWYGEGGFDARGEYLNWGYVENESKGPHTSETRYIVWAYRIADVEAVKAGTKKHYEVLPYAMWKLDLPLYDRTSKGVPESMSATFDDTTNRIYVSCHHQDGDVPIIQVLEIQ